MIHISLSPNLEKEDVFVALRRLFSFWSWRGKKYTIQLKKAFLNYFNNENIYFYNSGRSALYVFLKSLNLKSQDEIILQSFTCNAVANPIMWAGAKPVYADIDETYNLNVEKLENKITPNTKAIIVQHTFGIPARIDKIQSIARKHNLILIEDCAHALGATYRGQKVGTFGDVAFFSFGRDKIISSVYGGALMVNNEKFKDRVEHENAQISAPCNCWTVQQLLHPIITSFALVTYNWFGKYFLYVMQKAKILSYAVTKKERMGKKPKYIPELLSDPLANLALVQFKKLDKLNNHRKKLAKIYENALKDNKNFYIVNNYDTGAIFLRYPVVHKNALEIIKRAKNKNIILGDWYREIIAPAGTDMEKINYTTGLCQNAEGVSPKVINLPTNIKTSKKDAERIIIFLKEYL